MSSRNEKVREEFKKVFLQEHPQLEDTGVADSLQWEEVMIKHPKLVDRAKKKIEQRKEEARKAVEERGERLLEIEENVSKLEKKVDSLDYDSEISSLQEMVSQLEEKLESLGDRGLQSREEVEKKYGIEFPKWITEDNEELPTYQALLALRGLIHARRKAVQSAIRRIGNWEHKENEGSEERSDYYHARQKMKKILTSMQTWFDAAGDYYRVLTREDDPGVYAEQHFFERVHKLAEEGRPPMQGWSNEDLILEVEELLVYKEDREELLNALSS